ncbi:E3 SUMO-protein ligase PIAS1-like isoform X3 [Cimex lectularius]|uniref:SP-RING-type domain-containing protein n=2 Tax=Cimex lectularius TaxID=79782 RepID=A0A8I6RH11_CIMLE|nr:E3 SUMO-protein ligase PIAS1-like isoform X3 [Cimex lectularius]
MGKKNLQFLNGCVNKNAIWEGEHFRLDEKLMQPQLLDTKWNLFKKVVQINLTLNNFQTTKLRDTENTPIKRSHKKQGPINITSVLTVKPFLKNSIKIIFQRSDKIFIGVLFIAQTPNPQLWDHKSISLIQEYKVTRNKIANLFHGADGDSDVKITSLNVSLKCPLSQILINVPCIGKRCMHIECFDMESYFDANSTKNPKWECPICRKGCQPDNLIIDGYWKAVLKEIPLDCTSVSLQKDGSWIPLCNSKN